MAVSLKKLDQEIEKLEALPYEDLLPKWIKHYGCNFPKGIKQPLLARAAVYHLQAKRMGGLKRETYKALLAISNGASHIPPAQKTELKPGMRLMREWHGKTHQYMESLTNGTASPISELAKQEGGNASRISRHLRLTSSKASWQEANRSISRQKNSDA